MKITIKKHVDIIEVEKEIIEAMKERLADNAPMTEEEQQKSDDQDFLER